MEKIKNTLLIILVCIVSLSILFFKQEDKKTIEDKIRIGVSDDTSGFVINYMKNREYLENTEVEELLEPYSIADC